MLQNQLQRKEKEGGRGGGEDIHEINRLNQQTYLQLDPQVQADPQEHFAFPQPDMMMMMMMVERVSTKKKCQEAIDHTRSHENKRKRSERNKETKKAVQNDRAKREGRVQSENWSVAVL